MTPSFNSILVIFVTRMVGAVLQGGYELSSSHHRLMASGSFPSSFFGNTKGKLTPIVFSTNLFQDLSSGSQMGSYVFRSSGEQLFISQNVHNVSIKLNIHGFHISAFRIQDGALVSLR